MTTPAAPANSNRYMSFLFVGGLVLVIIGLVVTWMQKSAAERAANVQEFVYSFDNVIVDVQPDYSGTAVGVGVLVLGIVMILAVVIIKAARRPAPVRQEPTNMTAPEVGDPS